jgi:hypothetical protein
MKEFRSVRYRLRSVAAGATAAFCPYCDGAARVWQDQRLVSNLTIVRRLWGNGPKFWRGPVVNGVSGVAARIAAT